jgi:hypothetical protein
MIFMQYRNVGLDSAIYGPLVFPGTAWLGGGPDIWVDDSLRRINMYWPGSPGQQGCGTTSVVNAANDGGTLNRPNYRVQIHELAHFFFGGNNWHNGGGFWAMLKAWASRKNTMLQSCVNSMERELLGWIAPDSIYQTTYNLTLTDYITTGRAVKIKVPGGNPHEYFRLEYHLRSSQFDTPEEHDPNAKGLYIIHQIGLGSPEDGFARLLPADGRWTWVSDEVVYPSYYPSGLAVYKRSAVDRVNGYDDSRGVPFTWIGPPPTPNVPNPSWIHFHRDHQTNQLIEQTIFRGDGKDAWSLAKNNVFTPWSNPNSQNQAKQKTWVGIEIINEISKFGTIVLNVYVDSAACVALPPSKPQDVTLSSNSGQYGNIRVTWRANQEPDLQSYEVSRAVQEFGGEWEVVATTTDTFWVDPEMWYAPEGGLVWASYRVRAKDTQDLFSVYSDAAKTRAEPGGKLAGEIPASHDYALEQNYPNPFNPATLMNYTIPEPGFVTLEIYNVLGQLMAVVARGYQSQGIYSVTWDAEGVASGVYIARFSVSDDLGRVKFSTAKKLLLAK